MKPSVADWGGGMSASGKPRVQLFADAGNGWPHSALRYMISSCQSAATSEIVKLLCMVTYSCKKRYNTYRDLYLYLYLLFLRATAGTAIARLSHRNSVRPSVRPSVCHTGGSGKNGAS